MRFRFIEARDVQQTNHGKFALMQFGAAERKHKSAIELGVPLLDALKPVRRFGGGWTEGTLLMADLQTREAMFFDPGQGVEFVTRQFLVHPLHVCILYYPLMRLLTENKEKIWGLPNLVELDINDVLRQPGVLLDADGQPVRGRFEWSARRPLQARLRNREVAAGAGPEEGPDVITEAEWRESAAGMRPKW